MTESYHVIQPPLFPFLSFEHSSHDCVCAGKLCSNCQTTQCYLAFHKDKKGKYGICAHCKVCVKAYQQENYEHIREVTRLYRETHRESVAQTTRLYGQIHREQKLVRDKQYRQRHPERLKEKDRRWREQHREHLRKSKRAYRQKNMERVRLYYSHYRRTHTEQIKASEIKRREVRQDHDRRRYQTEHRQQWYKQWNDAYKQHNLARYRALRKASGHRYRARKREAGGRFTASEWRGLVSQYQHRCLCCGRSEPEIKLTPDHVIPLSCRGDNTIANIQPLCISCNAKKGAKIIDYR